MPNDRASSSILQKTDWSKYQTLGKLMGMNNSSAQSSQSAQSANNPIAPTNPAADPQDQALDLFEQVLDETESLRSPSVIDQALPQAIEQNFVDAQQAQINAQVAQATQVGNRQKELLKNVSTPDQNPVENAPANAETAPSSEAAPQAETLTNPEIAEISQEIKEVGQEAKEQRERADIQEQQTAINNLAQAAKSATAPVAPVVVLPITETGMKEGQRKSSKFSLRWLAEWAEKISKMFSGAVLYKEEAVGNEDV